MGVGKRTCSHFFADKMIFLYFCRLKLFAEQMVINQNNLGIITLKYG